MPQFGHLLVSFEISNAQTSQLICGAEDGNPVGALSLFTYPIRGALASIYNHDAITERHLRQLRLEQGHEAVAASTLNLTTASLSAPTQPSTSNLSATSFPVDPEIEDSDSDSEPEIDSKNDKKQKKSPKVWRSETFDRHLRRLHGALNANPSSASRPSLAASTIDVELRGRIVGLFAVARQRKHLRKRKKAMGKRIQWVITKGGAGTVSEATQKEREYYAGVAGAGRAAGGPVTVSGLGIHHGLTAPTAVATMTSRPRANTDTKADTKVGENDSDVTLMGVPASAPSSQPNTQSRRLTKANPALAPTPPPRRRLVKNRSESGPQRTQTAAGPSTSGYVPNEGLSVPNALGTTEMYGDYKVHPMQSISAPPTPIKLPPEGYPSGDQSGYNEYHGWTEQDETVFAKQMEQAMMASMESSKGASKGAYSKSKEAEAGYGYGYGYSDVGSDDGAIEDFDNSLSPPLPPKDEWLVYEKKMLDATAKWMDETDSPESITPPGSPQPQKGKGKEKVELENDY